MEEIDDDTFVSMLLKFLGYYSKILVLMKI